MLYNITKIKKFIDKLNGVWYNMHAGEKGETIMFTYIELENFKSFEKIKFDFKQTKEFAKKFVVIYGENGSGKSNFVSSIELLSNMMTSYINTERLQELKKMVEEKKMDLGKFPEDIFDHIDFYELQDDLNKCRTIDSNDTTKATYGFMINDKEGYYSIAFDSDSIISEELYYVTNRQRGQLYKIQKEKEKDDIEYKFSSYLFNSEKYQKHISELIRMYWGKHSLLALILGEMKNKNRKFILDTISQNCLQVIENFMHVFILCKSPKTHTAIISGSDIHIRDFESVEIEVDDSDKKRQLDIIEKIINDFYTQAYTDIVRVYYKAISSQQNEEDSITYKLFVEKIIAGKVRVIPFSLESAGTQRVLFVLRAIIEAINGQTVIYDEIDDGIHDLLMRNILISVQDDITGQLIITTHNTLLLEDLNPKSAYVIYVDDEGYKEARCFDDYDIRIQSSHNQRRLYLNGVFGGVPYSSQINYSNMHIDSLEE